MAGCGGGSGDPGVAPTGDVVGPPTVAATLGTAASDATAASRATGEAADATIARSAAMGGLFGLVNSPGSNAPATPLLQRAAAASRKRALRAENMSCDDFVDLPCTGNAVADTNIAESATAVIPGDYIDIRFNNLSGRLFGASTSLLGRMRLDFQSGLNLSGGTLAGLNVLVTLEQLSGSLAGYAFGPVSDVGRLQVSATGVQTITAGGRSFSGLRSVTATGAGSFNVGAGTVRSAHWSAPGAYVDVTLSNWRVTANRPQVGSQATLTAASGRITLRVSASSATSVVYALSLSSPTGATVNYTVTASYPSGGGSPTYVATPA